MHMSHSFTIYSSEKKRNKTTWSISDIQKGKQNFAGSDPRYVTGGQNGSEALTPFVPPALSTSRFCFLEILKTIPTYDQSSKMSRIYEGWNEILKIQKFRRAVGKTIFFSFSALISYAYNSNTTRAGYSRGDQFYASYPAGSELLTDTTKLYKSALGNCFEEEEWAPIEWSIMSKHFERQGKSPYAYHAQYQAHLASNGQIDGSG
ncbi:hypothetical protein L1987_11064 [Smallanthus sonchifolius]|uniref:Uncharacterized protein n=1 Tax=Smallanthus sonchifolius TaxID=185202 RepID=A0ACB9JAH3_9ASTR|nr:hypothetical protein L1987_11064 [Smallanthus sonchifolius]